MLEPEEALARIVGAVRPLEAVSRPLSDAEGLVLAEDVVSPVSLPPWANSAMDGYACRSDDLSGATAATPVRLRVTERVAAGQFPVRAVGSGEAIRIATGAPVPDGADSVVRVEDTDRGDVEVEIVDSRDAGRNVRAAGEDVTAGAVALTAGATLGPARIALLAAIGASTVRVHRPPRVAIVATGDELVRLAAFDEVRAGRRIVSSNSYGLSAAVRAAGAEAIDAGIVRDDPAALHAVLERAANCDLILTTAGVSVGDADYVRDVVSSLGGKVDFWRVKMRPGSPLAFGSIRGTPWLGLPGNPVSALVTFTLFALPAIRRLAGRRDFVQPRLRVVADDTVPIASGLTHYLRVRILRDAPGLARAKLSGSQASNVLSSMALADGLMIVPAGRDVIHPGDVFEAIEL